MVSVAVRQAQYDGMRAIVAHETDFSATVGFLYERQLLPGFAKNP